MLVVGSDDSSIEKQKTGAGVGNTRERGGLLGGTDSVGAGREHPEPLAIVHGSVDNVTSVLRGINGLSMLARGPPIYNHQMNLLRSRKNQQLPSSNLQQTVAWQGCP